MITHKKPGHWLAEKYFDCPPIFAVMSGGLHPVLIPDLIKALGKDIILQLGGGIHAHPKGTMDGALAARQAIDAAMEGVSLEAFAETHSELKFALLKRGRKPEGPR